MRRVILLSAALAAFACERSALEQRLTEEAKVGAPNPGNDDDDDIAQPARAADDDSKARAARTSTTDHRDSDHGTRGNRARGDNEYFGADERGAEKQVIDNTDGRDTGVFRTAR